MFHLAWLGVRHNPARYVATLVAIVTGVAFFSATGFLSDRVLDALQGDVDRQYSSVDAAVIVDDDGRRRGLRDKLRIAGPRPTRSRPPRASRRRPESSPARSRSAARTARCSQTGRPVASGSRTTISTPSMSREGAAPAAAGEIAVDKGLAGKHDLTVGDKVTLLTLAGPQEVTIVGITKFGSSDSIDGGGTVSISKENAFDWLSSGQVEYQALYIRGSGDQAALVAAIKPLVPDGFKVQDGDELPRRQAQRDRRPAQYLKKALQAFALLAMLVGGFVIYNTFSVIVAQRLRELAVMSAIGATPKQIKRRCATRAS